MTSSSATWLAKGSAMFLIPPGWFTPLQSAELVAMATEMGSRPQQVTLAWLMARRPNMLVIPGTPSASASARECGGRWEDPHRKPEGEIGCSLRRRHGTANCNLLVANDLWQNLERDEPPGRLLRQGRPKVAAWASGRAAM